MSIEIRRASVDDTDAIAPLFDLYRMFYSAALGPGAGSPLHRRAAAARAVGDPVGRTRRQGGRVHPAVPSFSSVRAGRSWILNDLYVQASARRNGIARALLQAAADFARADGAIRLELETDPDNRSAQSLYRHMGWEPYEGTLRFRLHLQD